MTEWNMPQQLEQLAAALGRGMEMRPRDVSGYASMRWPRLIPMMRFSVHAWSAEGYGNVFAMSTDAMHGMMRLGTLVCTPNERSGLPVLLIDMMSMRQKQAAFVEYYDCNESPSPQPELQAAHDRYASIPDYAEKPAWYIRERAPYSLIKGGSSAADLQKMLAAEADAYACRCLQEKAPISAADRQGLKKFTDRMVREGNPSSAVLARVLGKREAERFFRMMVMPAEYQPAEEERG